MVVRTSAAPPTPWSRTLAEPKIHETAYVHSFSNLIGDVRIGANVLIAPGTSIRADEGSPFHIGEGTNVQDGVVIHGLEKGRVIGDDEHSYSVWVGNNTAITHMALIHGPAYIGNNCFIGFRSTVFNARIGDGCIIMMHALIQDVEIPPGRYVPSGAVITNQQQADRLPSVQESDIKFATHVVGINAALRSGYQCAESTACITPIRNEQNQSSTSGWSEMNTYSYSQPSGNLDASVVNHVRQLLAQGFRIGTEHADERRFQTSSWKSCAPIQSTREGDILRELEACLSEHSGEYVRLIGIDTRAKKRVLETIIQRPAGKAVPAPNNGSGRSASYSSSAPAPAASYRPAPSSSGHAASGLGADVVQMVRHLLAQGARIGTEHADQRRFQTSSWHSCSPIQSTREGEVLSSLEACMAEHAGEYVRLFGIDTRVKRRIGDMIIQRPNSKGLPPTANGSSRSYTAPSAAGSSSSVGGYATTSRLDPQVVQQVSQLIGQGCQIGLEYADERRFKTSSWQSATTLQIRHESEAIAAIEAFLSEHSRNYVRLVGINPKAKRRVTEMIIHRPNGKSVSSPARTAYTPTASAGNVSNGNRPSSSGSASLGTGITDQVRQLLSQSYKVGVEYADERRYKTSSWQTGNAIQGSREADVMASLQAFLNEHSRDYVRLIGTDPKSKRRVVEVVIQKPGQAAVR